MPFPPSHVNKIAALGFGCRRGEGWYSHADRGACDLWWGLGRQLPRESFEFFNRAMASLAISYSNFEDRSSYWNGQDNTWWYLNTYDLSEFKYRELTKEQYGSSGYVYKGDYPLQIAGSGDKRLGIWYDAEEVFWMLNETLYNKPNNYYGAARIRAAYNRLYGATHNYTTLGPPTQSMTTDDIVATLIDAGDPYGFLAQYRYVKDTLHEGKLEAMLMENLYHIRYSGEGLEPNPSVQAEHKKQIKRNTGKDI